jgi:uncharacterized protein
MSEHKPDAVAADASPNPAAKTCVNCGKPQNATYKPFCSKRCADIDLGRWLKGSYAIPAEDPPEFEEGAENGDS